MVAHNGVAVVTYDTDGNMIDHRPTPDQHDALWRALVIEHAARAIEKMPESTGRIELAEKLVLSGAVTWKADGTARVQSGTREGEAYDVNGACTCPDYARAPQNWCKHRIARVLYQRAQTALFSRLQAPQRTDDPPTTEETPPMRDPGPTPPPAGDQAPLPEAPASANAFVVIDGHRVQITVRGTSLQGVLTEIRTVLAQYPAASAARDDAQAPAGPPPCPTHGSERLKRSKFRGWYCSGRLESGDFCKYEVKD